MPIEVNQLETARFGVVCARLEGAELSMREVDAIANRQGIAMVSTRVHGANFGRIHALEANGFQLMDTLVYFACDLRRLSPADYPAEIGPLRSDEIDAVEEVAAKAFCGFAGHFHTDPRLAKRDADAAYAQWGRTVAMSATDSNPVYVARYDARVTGFIALAARSNGQQEIVLNAVHPEWQGQGIYNSLLRFAVAKAAQSGIQRLLISTQLTNYHVQRVWCRNGFLPMSSFYTFHKWYDL